MIPLGPVVARTRTRAPRAIVWSFLVEQREAWWPELKLEPGVGGRVTEQWTETDAGASVSRDAEGVIDVWVDGHALGFTWRDAGDVHTTAVLVTLRSQGAETGITVTETGFDALPNGAERALSSQEGWQVLLRDLTASVEAAAPVTDAETDAEAGSGFESAPHVAAEVEAAPDAEAGSDAEVGSDTEAAPHAEPAPVSDRASEAEETEEAEDSEETEEAESSEVERGDNNDTVEIERLAPEAATGAAIDFESTGDPDFDTLLRGA